MKLSIRDFFPQFVISFLLEFILSRCVKGKWGTGRTREGDTQR